MNSQIDVQGSRQQQQLFGVIAPVLAHKAKVTNFSNVPQSKGHNHNPAISNVSNALCLERNSERFSASNTSRNPISSIQQLIRHVHLAFGKQITAGVWCKISSESAALVIFSTKMLGNQNAGWDTKPWNYCWYLQIWAGLPLQERWRHSLGLWMPERVKLRYPERKRRNQSEPVLHCHVVLVGKVLNSPQPCSPAPWRSRDFRGAPSLSFQADSHHFNRPWLVLLVFSSGSIK